MDNNQPFRRTASRWSARPTLELTPALGTMIASAAAIVLLASVHASYAAEDSTRIMQERHACAAILGLDPSERPYDDCIRSLDRTLSVVKVEQVSSDSGRNGAVAPDR
jgi:hypothetical protein